MDKLKMQSHDVTGSNLNKIARLFPNCVTERLGKNGKPELAIDFEKLEAEYRGKADVVFIDVWEKPDEGKKYGTRAIPTQIFYNKKGEEVGRHEGFLDEKSIRGALDKLLAE